MRHCRNHRGTILSFAPLTNDEAAADFSNRQCHYFSFGDLTWRDPLRVLAPEWQPHCRASHRQTRWCVRGVVSLMSGMPPAVLNYVFALQYGRDPQDVASLVVGSTLASVLTLPVVLSLILL